jgi:hypothetical protein
MGGDREHERYSYGIMFGLETAHDELAQIAAALSRSETTLNPQWID